MATDKRVDRFMFQPASPENLDGSSRNRTGVLHDADAAIMECSNASRDRWGQKIIGADPTRRDGAGFVWPGLQL